MVHHSAVVSWQTACLRGTSGRLEHVLPESEEGAPCPRSPCVLGPLELHLSSFKRAKDMIRKQAIPP